RARQALEDCIKGELRKTRILYVVSTRTGGTPQTNRDLMGAIDDAVDGWLLRCDSSVLELSQLVDGEIVPVKHHSLAQHVDPISHRSNEYDAVVNDWLLELDPDIVHIRHLGWHGLSLPQICRQLDIRTVFSFHDFYTLCPNVKLIDAEQNFCGGTCTLGEKDCGIELWPANSLPKLRDGWVHIWRERFSSILKHCDVFITTSDSARDRILEHFPHLAEKRFSVIPHGRDFSEFNTIRQTPEIDERIRILVPGNINDAKGLAVIEALITHDKAECLEFHILGDINMHGRTPHPRIIRHGKYSRHEFAAKAAKTRPHVGAIFSIWDETYCHTLTELWSVGLPAMVFDFATVGGRVRESGAGWVLEHGDIAALYERILDAVFDPEEMKEKTSAVDAWQRGYGRGNTTRIMGVSYLQVYRRVLRQDAPKLIKIGVVCPQDVSLKDANASTQIRVWERTHNHIDRELLYIRMHPASLLDLAQRGEIDGAIIQRTAIPRPMVERLRRTLKEHKLPFIMELDDDLLHVPEDKDPSGKYKDHAPFLEGLLTDASAVTVSTPRLQKKMSRVNSNVALVPNLLSERLWLEKPLAREKDGTIRALYMGTNTHIEDLKLILPALEKISAQYPMFRLSLIGISEGSAENLPAFVEVIQIPQEKKSYRKFVAWLREQAANVDFGIAPLADTEFNSSKSPLKILEYGALGLPVLVSDTVVYRELGKTAPQVKLVKNKAEYWVKAIEAQLRIGADSREQGAVLRDWVLSNAMLRPSLEAYDALMKQIIQ
ncbi:glycosyltransferase, partial [Litoreibacter halocynthiae]|uniref:glycosyltransferase n=1 Tax=Litoreibacter halocynthiae TaxID=1242689 RepID=UPI00248F8841